LWADERTGTVGPVNGRRQPTRLELEVQLEARPIRGRVYDRDRGGAMDRPFSGWLGLMSAIDAAVGPDRLEQVSRKETGDEGTR
jgi:hypothetical protein